MKSRHATDPFTARLLALLVSASGLPAAEATESDPVKFAWDGQLFGYGESYTLQDASVLNPDNAIADLPESVLNAEARFNLKAEAQWAKLILRPILVLQGLDPSLGEPAGNQLYLSQGVLRLAPWDGLAVSAGRELLTWGPAQFRSPSNPFYFNNGRNNPNRELSGVDTARVTWTPDQALSISAGWVMDSGFDAPDPDPWEDTWLVKLDVRGFDWAGGLALAKPSDRDIFVGLHAQWTIDEAWLIYGEASSSTSSNALEPTADRSRPFAVAEESPRRDAALLGAAWTMENAQTINLEYLYYGPGYTGEQESAYFARASALGTEPPAIRNPSLGLALNGAPPLLGQHYLYAVWQNNVLSEGPYWRLMWARSLTDASNEFSAYGKYPLNDRLVLFGLAVLNTGGPRREAESLLSNAVNLGVRLALP